MIFPIIGGIFALGAVAIKKLVDEYDDFDIPGNNEEEARNKAIQEQERAEKRKQARQFKEIYLDAYLSDSDYLNLEGDSMSSFEMSQMNQYVVNKLKQEKKERIKETSLPDIEKEILEITNLLRELDSLEKSEEENCLIPKPENKIALEGLFSSVLRQIFDEKQRGDK